MLGCGTSGGVPRIGNHWGACDPSNPKNRRRRVSIAVEQGVPAVPVLPTGAGHDAGILASAGVNTAMLFVRNPTGVSHSPHEHAERDDCLAGVEALTAVLRELA